MEGRKLTISLAIFTVVAVILFIVCQQVLQLNDGISVVIALAGAFACELLYLARQKCG